MIEEQESHGSFPSGLVVGFLAGAVGYFIAQTEEGKKMKEEFMSHWHELKDTLVKEGVISETESEITDYISAIRGKIDGFIGNGFFGDYIEKPELSRKKSRKVVKKKLFRGI